MTREPNKNPAASIRAKLLSLVCPIFCTVECQCSAASFEIK